MVDSALRFSTPRGRCHGLRRSGQSSQGPRANIQWPPGWIWSPGGKRTRERELPLCCFKLFYRSQNAKYRSIKHMTNRNSSRIVQTFAFNKFALLFPFSEVQYGSPTSPTSADICGPFFLLPGPPLRRTSASLCFPNSWVLAGVREPHHCHY